jgi:hypothetical protein
MDRLYMGPYTEKGEIRTFSKDTEPDELKWHRDREERIVSPIGQNDWLFQRDNELPKPIEGDIRIPKGEWHRVIKGTTDLVVRVQKL